MLWETVRMNEEAEKLIQELEEQNGGKIRYKTYALYIGRSGEGGRELGGLLYGIDDRLIFEDFERQQNSMLQLLSTKKPEYEKFKIVIPAGAVTSVRSVILNHAKAAISGRIKPEKVAEANGLRRMFGRNAVELQLAEGAAIYLELFDVKGFTAYMEELA